MKQAGNSCRGQSEVCRKDHVCSPRYLTQLTKIPTGTRSQLSIESNLKRQSIGVGSDRVWPSHWSLQFQLRSHSRHSLWHSYSHIHWWQVCRRCYICSSMGVLVSGFPLKRSTIKWCPSEKNQKSNEESEILDLFHHCRYQPSGKQKIFEASSIPVLLN